MSAQTNKEMIVVYHGNCIDGAACAWAVTEAHHTPPENVTFIPYEHYARQSAEDAISKAVTENPNAQVFFVDVAPEKDFLDDLMQKGLPSIDIYDHHKSAAIALKEYTAPTESVGTKLNIQINDQHRSASKYVWTDMMPNRKVPDVLEVIDKMDGDASGLITPEDFAAAAVIDSRDNSTIHSALDTLRGLAKSTFNEMAEKGKPVLSDQENRIRKAISDTAYTTIQILPDTVPVTVPLINANVQHFGRQISEEMIKLGHENDGAGIALAWAMKPNGAVSVSLRTNGDPDLSQVTAHLRNTMNVTGGGHAGAGAVHFKDIFEFAKHMTPHPKPAPKQDLTAKNTQKPNQNNRHLN